MIGEPPIILSKPGSAESTVADPPHLSRHIAETVQAVVQLHADHRLRSTRVEKVVDRWTAALGRPSSIIWLVCVVTFWVGLNLLLRHVGYVPFDRPPFPWLNNALAVIGLVVLILILSTQRRADQLADVREQITLELASLTERKVAKVIDLIEELRRDSPHLTDRVDHEAREMAERKHPGEMLGVIKETHEEIVAKHGDCASDT
jgi:uncharacterized membrane protein